MKYPLPTLAGAVAVLALAACSAPQPASSPAWFGLTAPTGLVAPTISPDAATAAAIPKAVVPPGEVAFTELEGARIKPDVEKVVGFAEQMRKAGNQMWGRISGFPSEAATADWVAGQLRAAGVQDVKVETYSASADFWWPKSWEARVLGDPAYGAGSKDVLLASAMPVSRSQISGTITAPVVFVGEAGSVSSDGVAGKIAVEHTRPATGAYSDRAKVRESSAALIKAGAIAVLNWVEQGGNMHVFDFGNCGGPCFNIGGEDGRFLAEASARAKAAGAPPLRMSLKLDAEMKSGLTARNVIGVIPGASSEIIVVNAHLDSWYSGAGDNADGVAVLLALARHYGKPANRPARTLVFVGSGGHHSPGMNGPGNLLPANADLLKKAVLVVNLEHLAQFEIQAVPTWQVHATEEPKNFGVSNMSPFLVSTVKAGVARYGFVIKPEITNSVPGDLGGYAPLNVARIQGIHSGPLYHTSGDQPASISTAGLERAARFYRYVIDEAAKAPAAEINP
ncbi:MAG: M28 family peptidase [Alphaproteobacteria bacterium]|nr:M28 family peptidase [Alphaproteobacteria bacterium]